MSYMGILLYMFASPKNYYSGKFYLAQVLIQMYLTSNKRCSN